MTATVQLEADLAFSISSPATDESGATEFSGSIRARGNQVEVRSDDLMSIAGQPSRQDVRSLAAELARYGLTVHVRGPHGVVVTLGDVGRAPLSRLVTRSRHMRIASLREAATAVLARRRSAPGAITIEPPAPPPGTPWPLLPTLRGRSRTVTTTHDPARGGRPRLYLADVSDPSAPGPLGVFSLGAGTTMIGSDPDMHLVLEGTDGFQAEIRHTDEDEYVLVPRSTQVPSTVAGQQHLQQTLRTGARIQLGPWRMTFVRDEFADHGRPYGGRIGGELGRQRTQPKPEHRTSPSW